ALVAPVGNEGIEADRIDHRAGEDMRADLRALLQHDDGELIASLGGKLLQPDRRGEPGRSGADNNAVELHGFALDRLRIDRFWLRRFAQGSLQIGSCQKLKSFPKARESSIHQ